MHLNHVHSLINDEKEKRIRIQHQSKLIHTGLHVHSFIRVHKHIHNVEVFKMHPSIIWFKYQTRGLSKWSCGLFVHLHTSPPSWEQLATFCAWSWQCTHTHTHTHTHSYTTDQEAHVLTLVSRSHTHNLSLSDTHIHLTSIPLQEPPGPACGLKNPICLFLWGLWGGGGGWNASKRVQGPLSRSSLITAPPQPPHTHCPTTLRPPTPSPPGTQAQWTWARVNCMANLGVR